MKTCSKCQQQKDLSFFYKRTDRDAPVSHCKECVRVKSTADRSKKKEYDKQRYLEKAASIRERVNLKNMSRETRDKKKKYDQERRTITAAQRRKRYASDPAYKITCNLRSRLYGALKRSKTKRASKIASTIELIGCSPAELKLYIEKKFTGEMTWDNVLRGEIHIDHIRPCVSFDLTDPQQQKLCFNYQNLQPLWALDNLSKGGRFSE